HGHRVVGIDRLAGRIALHQPHAAPAPQVDGRDDQKARIAAHARHSITPLVEGTPTTRGSRATASLRARANALKPASRMWWLFLPASCRRCSVIPAVLTTARKNSSPSSASNSPTRPL